MEVTLRMVKVNSVLMGCDGKGEGGDQFIEMGSKWVGDVG